MLHDLCGCLRVIFHHTLTVLFKQNWKTILCDAEIRGNFTEDI